MNAFSRSWEITKLSFSVIGQDREMLLFPILGGFFSLLYTAAIVVPTWLFVIAPAEDPGQLEVFYYAGLFIVYLGLAFVATFFNTCVVYTTKTRFEGGDAGFGESLSFAFSRIHLIFAWSLVAATVGLLLRLLDNLAERLGFIGQIVLNIVTSLLGLLWSVITIFVVPSMVYHGLGPIDAIKRSVAVLKKTWGESLIRHYGLGLMQFLCVLLGVAVFGALLIASGGGKLAIAIAVVAVIYFIGMAAVFSVANTIFNTALYVYADTGEVPSGYNQEIIAGAIGPRQSRSGGLFG
jgi:hypothetical protein